MLAGARSAQWFLPYARAFRAQLGSVILQEETRFDACGDRALELRCVVGFGGIQIREHWLWRWRRISRTAVPGICVPVPFVSTSEQTAEAGSAGRRSNAIQGARRYIDLRRSDTAQCDARRRVTT